MMMMALVITRKLSFEQCVRTKKVLRVLRLVGIFARVKYFNRVNFEIVWNLKKRARGISNFAVPFSSALGDSITFWWACLQLTIDWHSGSVAHAPRTLLQSDCPHSVRVGRARGLSKLVLYPALLVLDSPTGYLLFKPIITDWYVRCGYDTGIWLILCFLLETSNSTVRRIKSVLKNIGTN